MSAEDVLIVVGRLADAGITVWLEGGWGVDALVGEQTRRHDDLDLVVALNDVPALERVLVELGYERAGGSPPLSFESVDADGRQVDSHPVTFDAVGNGLYLMAQGQQWIYPAAGFLGSGTVGRSPVRCLTPEVQVLCHDGYELADKDRHDLLLLTERFGT